MKSIERIAVVGAGTMGHGIAQVSAQAGYHVILNDVAQGLVDRGLERIEGNLKKGVALGKGTDDERRDALSRLTGSADLEGAVAEADLVIEAVPESIEIKLAIFARVLASVPQHAIVASNTSSLSIDALASHLSRPGRFLGLHFFNPVHIMALVEVVRGTSTEDAVLSQALEYVRRIGKEPVVVHDSPGFASSRLGVAIGLEAMRMLEEGVATAEDIDKAMTLGYRHPMGPLRLTDLVGLDVRLGIAEYLHAALGMEHFRPPDVLRRLVSEGKLGKKSGQGFYDWSEES